MNVLNISNSNPGQRSKPDHPTGQDGSKGCKVLFVNPPSIPYTHLVEGLAHRFSALHQTTAMPMGILYLAAVLERELPGVEIRVVDMALAVRDYSSDPDRAELDLEQFTSLVLEEQVPEDFVPDFIGISILFSTAHRSSTHIAAAIKSRWAEAPIVVGGMHSTNAVPGLLEFSQIDYVCRGEAESIISQFATKVVEGGDVEEIPGIIGRSKMGLGEGEQSAPLIKDLDTIPLPAWHLIDMPKYLYASHSNARRIGDISQDGEATIVTTRGCPFLCTFCSSWTVHGRVMRYRSTANVIEELTQLKERYNVSAVIPEDDLFTVKKARILDLCQAVSEKFGKSLSFQFPNALSVATLDDDVIYAMVNMGMSLANIAIESGSPYVQKHVIKKNCDLERARRVVMTCREAGALVRTYFILGFPGETREQMQETIDFAASLPVDWSLFNIAAPLIGTEMYDQLLERGEIDQSFNWDSAFYQERVFDSPEIGAQELKDLGYATNIRLNFFENYNLRIGDYERATNLFQDVLAVYPAHLVAQYCIGIAFKATGEEDNFREAMDLCREMLSKEDYALAHTQYHQFRDWFTELPELLIEPPVVESRRNGPRPGMPNKARQAI